MGDEPLKSLWERGKKPRRWRSGSKSGLLGELRCTLPDQFLPLVDRVLKNLHKLTAPSYPFVLTHGDFSEFNLLLDEVSGAISGVVDWPEACILPFGFTLHGVEYGLGAMYANGWRYRENASRVREHFWATFKQIVQPTEDEVEAMKLARLAGILFRYGTRSSSHHSDTMCGVRGHGSSDSSLQFIEAFTRDETD